MNLPSCEKCGKVPSLCVCQWITPKETRLKVLILQHPQEPDHELGTGRIASLSLSNAKLKVGLSWRNLKKACEDESAVPGKWGVLHLGSGIKGNGKVASPLQLVTKAGAALPEDVQQRQKKNLEGFIVLDGTWSQAKTLWWRNAWLLKLQRMILVPPRPSLYGNLRKEPRRDCLSTIETVGFTLSELGEPAQIQESLEDLFKKLISLYKK